VGIPEQLSSSLFEAFTAFDMHHALGIGPAQALALLVVQDPINRVDFPEDCEETLAQFGTPPHASLYVSET
jgi:hypothetical protein